MISTARRVQYALGYLELGMIRQANEELAAVAPDERATQPVVGAHLAIQQACGQWEQVEELAHKLIELDDMDAGAWIALGCAVRRTKGIEAARDLLRAVEPRLGATCATLHYNLACYECLTGDHAEARRRLERACAMDAGFKDAAKLDPDLADLQD